MPRPPWLPLLSLWQGKGGLDQAALHLSPAGTCLLPPGLRGENHPSRKWWEGLLSPSSLHRAVTELLVGAFQVGVFIS